MSVEVSVRLLSVVLALVVLPACQDPKRPAAGPRDHDGDGLPAAQDCDDEDPALGGPELPYDGLDNDCDPSTLDDDLDGDGWPLIEDCDDTDPTLGGTEVAYDGLDNDCDPTTPDDDLDADGAPLALDCDDADPARAPGLPERCDGVDEDCDGAVDEDALDALTSYEDLDGDGFGDDATATVACAAGPTLQGGDCDDADPLVHPEAAESCDRRDEDCDGVADEIGACPGHFGGHRVDRDGLYVYALHEDPGVGVLGTSAWYGRLDRADLPLAVAWSEDASTLYYNDLSGQLWSLKEPFGDRSTLVGTFPLGQVGGGALADGRYFVGDFGSGDIWAMDVATGESQLYASLGSVACKPYFGNSSLAVAGPYVYAASDCGVVLYQPGQDALMLNSQPNLVSAVAMDADQELYTLDYSGHLAHIDRVSGAVIEQVLLASPPATTWALALDENGDVLVNYFGAERLFSRVDGRELQRWDPTAWYPGHGDPWYVSF